MATNWLDPGLRESRQGTTGHEALGLRALG